jgi:diguanylate cyclase (GGDEF)-like protein/PAS domain S-box-containing protein
MSNKSPLRRPASVAVEESTTTVVRSGVLPTAVAEALLKDVHPLLRKQLAELRRSLSNDLDVRGLLRVVSDYYEQVEEERRGIVRSMQLMSDEARSLTREITEQSSGHLQLILDNIKDVVITVDAEGAVETFNPTGERVFGYSQAEIIGRRLDVLVPALAEHPSVREGLRRLATSSEDTHIDLAASETLARHKDGHQIPVDMAVSRARVHRRELFVVCIRDATERRDSERALRESEARYRTLVDHAPEVIVVFDADTLRFIDVNQNAENFFKMTREQLLAVGPEVLSPPTQADGLPSMGPTRGNVERALEGKPQIFEWIHRDALGNDIPCEVRLVRLPDSQRRVIRGSITDITERKRAERISAGERAVFERLAANAPLDDALESIALLIETVCHDRRCTISVLAPDSRSFEYVIAPSLPQRLRAVLDGSVIDIRNGSCAAAVYLGRQVLVADVSKDPFWQSRRDVALECHLQSAWSTPIKAGSGKVLGALGVYGRGPGLPGKIESQLIKDAAQLAGIAIERRAADTALRSSEQKFRHLFENAMEGVFQSTRDGRLLSVNPAFVKMLGYSSAEELYALPSAAMLYWHPADRADFVRRLEETGEIRNAEFRLRRRDGAQIVVMESARATYDEAGRIDGYEGTVADITERKRAEQAMFAEKERAQVTLQSIGDAVISTDATGSIDYINPIAEQLTGWTIDEGRGRPIGEVLSIVSEATRAAVENPLLVALRTGQQVGPGEQSVLVSRNGQSIAIQDSASPIRDRLGKTMGAVIVFHDVTKERRLKRALAYQASHDALTGLINRREFDNRLHEAVQAARRENANYALLYVDLDQFKLVNDTCGHPAGDRLIRDITGLLQTRVRASDTIARLGGDEFGVLLEHCTLDQARVIAESVRHSVRDYRFVWGSASLSVGASIGVVAIDAQTESAATALSAADIACYSAKEQGRNRIHVYDGGGTATRHREMHWVSQVTRAVDEGRLELFFQPIQPIGKAGRPAQAFAELTVRLRDDSGVLVPPSEFIPAAERYNVMSMIDRWVVQRAVDLLRQHRAAAPLLAVNLSGTSLNDQGFLEYVLGRIDEPAIARGLCFEITETAAVANLQNAIFFMQELRERGCRFSLDDFGCGLSSFMYLKTLPVDFLKIDGQFVANIARDAVDRSMVEAISQVGRALGIATVAECVESAEVLAELEKIGLDFAQGFHVAKPRPVAEFGAAAR